MPYEVQMLTSHQTWRNACVYDEGDGVIRDEIFGTHKEAQAALFELLADIAADIARGFCPPWQSDDFRIAYVPATRATALLIVPFAFFALVFAFATLYLKCNCFAWRDINADPTTKVVTVSTTALTNQPWEAVYVSLGVITTAATEYTPANESAHLSVISEIMSGLLLILMAFPILAGRLAIFEEAASTSRVPDGRFRIKKLPTGDWQVGIFKETQVTASKDFEEVEVVVKDGDVESVKKVG